MKPSRALPRTALFAVVTLVAGLIRLPIGPIPLTFQSLAVLLAGLLLSTREAFYAMCLHLVLKILISGSGVVFSPSFGFVIGFIPAASLLAMLNRKPGTGRTSRFLHLMLASAVLYVVGLPYMAALLYPISSMTGPDWIGVIKTGMLVFLPGDLFKALLALVIAERVSPLLTQ